MILYYVTDFYICIGYCSPEHPSLRARGRSMLGGDRRSFREYPDDVGPSRFIHTIQLIFLPSAFYKLMRHAHLYMFLCLLISKNLWLPSITFIACWDLKRLLPLSFSKYISRNFQVCICYTGLGWTWQTFYGSLIMRMRAFTSFAQKLVI